ncbi:hypothetical protein AB1N83_009289 [Pleurotus pulmonarius]
MPCLLSCANFRIPPSALSYKLSPMSSRFYSQRTARTLRPPIFIIHILRIAIQYVLLLGGSSQYIPIKVWLTRPPRVSIEPLQHVMTPATHATCMYRCQFPFNLLDVKPCCTVPRT